MWEPPLLSLGCVCNCKVTLAGPSWARPHMHRVAGHPSGPRGGGRRGRKGPSTLSSQLSRCKHAPLPRPRQGHGPCTSLLFAVDCPRGSAVLSAVLHPEPRAVALGLTEAGPVSGALCPGASSHHGALHPLTVCRQEPGERGFALVCRCRRAWACGDPTLHVPRANHCPGRADAGPGRQRCGR